MLKSFIQPTVKVLKKADNTKDIVAALLNLKKKDVLIGIPEDKGIRKNKGVTNAQLAYIHSNGSPLNKIPPRPFLEPAIEADRDKLATQQGRVIKAALDGQASIAVQEMEKTGLIGQTAAKMWFVDPRNHWAPNAPITIQRKGSDRPLIDTGQLRNAITYVIRDAY